METYRFNENTLLHSIGFDIYKLHSILTNGIVSKNEAMNKKINYSRNYFGYNLDDCISMTKPFYSNVDDDNSCYKKYVEKGISLVVENQDYISSNDEMYFNHADEVFVKDKVDVSKFVGIMVPEKALNIELRDLPMLPLNSTSYINIKHCCDNILTYLISLGYQPKMNLYNENLIYLYNTIKALDQDKNDEQLKEDFEDSKEELDYFISNEVQNCFKVLLSKDSVVLDDVLNYINEKTLNLPIYKVKKQTRMM